MGASGYAQAGVAQKNFGFVVGALETRNTNDGKINKNEIKITNEMGEMKLERVKE